MKQLNYNDGQQRLNGISAVPKRPRKINVEFLILPAWMGIDKHAKNTASQLSQIGYYMLYCRYLW